MFHLEHVHVCRNSNSDAHPIFDVQNTECEREKGFIKRSTPVNRVYSVNLSLPLVVLPRLQRSLESCDLLEGILSESWKCTNDDINKPWRYFLP